MKIEHTSPATAMYRSGVNYKIGDDIVAKEHPTHVIGKCTGFVHNNTCIEINILIPINVSTFTIPS